LCNLWVIWQWDNSIQIHPHRWSTGVKTLLQSESGISVPRKRRFCFNPGFRVSFSYMCRHFFPDPNNQIWMGFYRYTDKPWTDKPWTDKPWTDKPWTRQTLDTTNPGHDKPRTRQTLDTIEVMLWARQCILLQNFFTFSRIFSFCCTLICHLFLQATGT
jgi:hypothetical protein